MTVSSTKSTKSTRLNLFALDDFPMVKPGDDLAAHIIGYGPQTGDVIAIAQKIVSKAQGRIVRLSEVSPSELALSYAEICDKDARVVELILGESVNVLRAVRGLMIVEHRLGFILANAGIDASNAGGTDQVILLPENPDETARELADKIKTRTGATVGIVITDSWGRPWRLGTVGFAIGVAGIPALRDLKGQSDLDGRILEATEVGTADELAAAASLLMGQADEGSPVIVIRGLTLHQEDGRASDLLRSVEIDQFR